MKPGQEVKRDLNELWTLFDDPQMMDGRTTVVFERAGRYTSFIRRTDRYERILREFGAAWIGAITETLALGLEALETT